MRYSLFLQKQFPLNTCPFWWTGNCGFGRRQLALAPPPGGDDAASAPPPPPAAASKEDVDAAPGPLDSLDVSLVTLGLGPAQPRQLSTSKQSYSTGSCAAYSSWNYMIYVVWNVQNADEVAAKDALLNQFALMASATRGAANCSTYARAPAGASGSILMCAEVTVPTNTSWFAAPYGYAGLYVPKAYITWAASWLMRNADRALEWAAGFVAACAPVIAVLEAPPIELRTDDRLALPVHLVSDLHHGVDGLRVIVTLSWLSDPDRVLHRAGWTGAVGPDDIVRVGVLRARVPQPASTTDTLAISVVLTGEGVERRERVHHRLVRR